jgi:putative ABC transport system permease protein
MPAARRSPRPPRISRLLLQIILHPVDRDPVLADLEEEFEARAEQDGVLGAARWYRAQVRRSVWPAIERRLIRPRGPTVASELRWALRGWRARPVVATVQASLVALAVAASGIVFAAADAFVFRLAPYPNADRLVVFQRTSPVGLVEMLDSREYRTLAARPDLFSGLFLYAMGPSPLFQHAGIVDSVRVYDIETGLFDALGVQPRWGRPLLAGDELPGREPVALLREDFARTIFGEPAAALGQSIDIEGAGVRVVGVMPPDFRFPTGLEAIWRPLAPPPPGRDRMGQTIAVLPPGARLETVAAMAEALVSAGHEQSEAIGPVTVVAMPRAHKDPRAFTNSGAFTSFDAPRLFTMLTGVAICLASIVWLNVAGLSLGSALERVRVHALQTALGASRATLVRTAVLEAALPASLGALAGLGLATWGASALSAALPRALGSMLTNPIDIDGRAAAFMAIVAGAAAVATSLPAAWLAARPRLADRLRLAGSTVTMSRRQMAARYVLMTGQVSLTVMLLVIAGLLVRSYLARLDEDKGFDSTALAAIEVRQPRGTPRKAADLDREILERLRSSPAVRSAARTFRLPPGLRGGTAADLWIQGMASAAGRVANTRFSVDPEYYRTMGIRLLAGRFTIDGDSPDKVVVDAEFAHRFWPDGNAVGARFWTGRAVPPKDGPSEIVGVASRVRLDTAQVPMGGDVYVLHGPMSRDSAPLTFVVRLASTEHLRDVTGIVRSMADGCLVRTSLMNDRYAEVYGDTRIAAGLTGGFALIAFPVAMVGLYGITAVLVSSRTREIGIRLALGAGKHDIRKLVLGPATRFLAAGIILGLLGALLASRAIESQLFGVKPVDPVMYAVVVAAIGFTSSLATWRPARRATNVDPIITLKAE